MKENSRARPPNNRCKPSKTCSEGTGFGPYRKEGFFMSKTTHALLAIILALAALATICQPTQATAATTADATLLNVVRVDYKDAGGTNSFAATASTKITVNLVTSALATYLPPAAGTGIPGGLVCPPAGSFDSGSTASFLYAVAAKANGDDDYTLSKSTGATTNVNNVTVNMEVLNYTGGGAVSIAGGGSVFTFGSAIPVGVSGTDTLLFPGGSLAGFAANDIVLVNLTTGGVKAFLVDTVTVGSAPDHSNGGNTFQTGTGSTTNEVQGQLKLKAYPDQSVTLNGSTFTFGGNVTPAFDTNAPVTGDAVGELMLVHVTVQASVIGTADGTVQYTLTTTDGSNPSSITCTAGNFKGVSLQIKKEVRNVTSSGAFGANASGNPGDILEYRVTVDSTAGLASQVTVTDAVPDYTTLIAGSAYGIAGGGDIFAQISDGSNTINITMNAADSEAQPGNPVETGFGKSTGTAASSPITFYVGDESTNALGGKVNSSTNYTILYQVKID